jgi:hypothetical protein
MPVDANIALGVKPPNVTGKLSDLLGVKRQAIEIQTAQAGAERARAETAGAQQTQKQRAALAEWDVGKIIGDDGMIDLNKIPDSGLREAAGDQYAEVFSKYATLRQQQLGTRQALVQLRDSQRDALNSMFGAIRSDPDVAEDNPAGRQKTADALVQYAEQYGSDALPIIKTYASALQKTPQGQLAQVLQNFQLQTTSAAALAERQAPKYTPTGSELKQTNPLAQPGQSPASIPLTLSPGERQAPVTGPDENLYVQEKDARGNIIGYKPAPGTPRFDIGEKPAAVGEAMTNKDQTVANRVAAQKAPEQLYQIRKARELSKGLKTDQWAAKRAAVESVLGSFIPGLQDATDDAAKLQELDKFLERVASTSSQVLGLSANTDAARESISRQNASIGYSPPAIQAVLDYAEAQTLAMQAKGNAQDRWFEEEGNGIKTQHKFESEWRRAYDPILFQLEVASDEEAAKITAKLSKEQKAQLREKRKKLIDMGALQ